jgi:nicotinate-nucleotide adenylyltransferase
VKLGILGGSFNPVHLGHILIADKAICALQLDRIVLVPAYRSPFKSDAKDMETGTENRLQMLAAAVCADNRIAIDDCEIRREGVSYTIDTLEDIIARYSPNEKPFLIIGDDLASDFPKWHDSKKILQTVKIVVARRVNSSKVDYPFPHIIMDNEVINISSQIVRQKIAEESGWRSLVPSGVRTIIEDRNLYGFKDGMKSDENCSNSLALRIENEARETISTARFLHSRNTALLAQDLCRRFGLDPMAGYIAGIAHDLCKQLDPKQMLKIAKTDGMNISALEKDRPNLLHGRAAAVLLKEHYFIHNKDILEAAAVHTMGSENMGLLAKVVFIADKTEVTRNIDPALRKMCYEENLDNILYAVLKKTISKLQSRKQDVSGDTLKLLEKLKGKKLENIQS